MKFGVIRRALPIFLTAGLVAALVLIVLYRNEVESYIAELKADEARAVEVAKQRIIASLNAGVSDTLVLADQETLAVWLETRDPEIGRRLAINYLAVARHRAIYDQARFIDTDGTERLRVNWKDGKPEIVPDDLLQDKSGTSYVGAMLKLQHGEIFVSRLDLNVEHGAIEEPHKPMIRYGAAIFDRRGDRAGMVVLNYRAQILLDRIRDLSALSDGNLWLVDSQGHWLRGPDRDSEWGFMFPERASRTLANANPEAWRRITESRKSDQVEVGGDLFTFTWITPAVLATAPGAAGRTLVGGEPSWALVSRVPAATLIENEAHVGLSFAIIGVAILLFNAVGSWLLARHRVAREAAEKSIRSSELFSRTLLEAAPDPIVVTDSGGRIVLVNAQTERLFGYSRAELVGQPVETLIPERFRNRHLGHRLGYLADPQPRQMGVALDLHALKRDGSEFPVSVSLSPAEIDGRTMIFADVRDISALRAAERQVNELNERLRRDNASLDQINRELEAFSYSVSHDLRAPLRAIDGFSQALLEDYREKVDDTGRDYLDRVRQATQRMGNLIDDMLKLARVSRLEISAADVDLTALAREIDGELRAREPGRQVEFAVDPHLSAHGDPRLLRVVLENLIGNAWKFTNARETARIEMRRRGSGDNASFFVRDNGAGFDMAYAGKLFGAFQRLHTAREFPGTGVGLATVQRIIHKHGGRIWADAEPDKGATFSFTLPPAGALEHHAATTSIAVRETASAAK